MKAKKLALSTALVIATAIGAFAHGGATGVVKERMDVMKDISEQMKVFGEMIKGQQPWNSEEAVRAARTIAGHSAHIAEMFPEGSIEGVSEAMPSIWTDWDRFVALSDELKSSASVLANSSATATAPGEIIEPFNAVGRTCSACHKDFRKAN